MPAKTSKIRRADALDLGECLAAETAAKKAWWNVGTVAVKRASPQVSPFEGQDLSRLHRGSGPSYCKQLQAPAQRAASSVQGALLDVILIAIGKVQAERERWEEEKEARCSQSAAPFCLPLLQRALGPDRPWKPAWRNSRQLRTLMLCTTMDARARVPRPASLLLKAFASFEIIWRHLTSVRKDRRSYDRCRPETDRSWFNPWRAPGQFK